MTMRLDGLTAAEVIRLLDLKPHPEGGHYRETFRDAAGPEGRGFSTAIYYLLDTGKPRNGTASMPPKSGIIMPALRL